MKALRHILVAMMLAAVAAAAGRPAAAPLPAPLSGWERVEAPRGAQPSGELRVYTSGRWVYVVTPSGVKVELLTVLGQRLTEATLPAGSHRYLINARGIYLLRADSSTYRITL